MREALRRPRDPLAMNMGAPRHLAGVLPVSIVGMDAGAQGVGSRDHALMHGIKVVVALSMNLKTLGLISKGLRISGHGPYARHKSRGGSP